MKAASKLFAFIILAVFCSVISPQTAAAKPHILFHTEHVYLHHAGEVEVVGYFDNDGDEPAYAQWLEFDLALIADNGQQMWADSGIRHYPDDTVYVPEGSYVAYTFYIQNPDIPEYHGHYRWKTTNNRTHWSKAAG